MDKKRPKKGSNKEWVNPNEPDAEIMKMKSGGTDMAHKAEHAVDMSGEGAVIAVTLHGGAKGDTKSLPDTLEKAQSNLQELANNAECCERIHEDAGREVVGDKGYHGNDILVELVLFFTLNREDFSFVIHLDRQPRTSRRREAQTGSRARSGSRSERTLDAVEHSRTLMEWWPLLIFHRGGLRIKVINNSWSNKNTGATFRSQSEVAANGRTNRPSKPPPTRTDVAFAGLEVSD